MGSPSELPFIYSLEAQEKHFEKKICDETQLVKQTPDCQEMKSHAQK